MARLPMGIAVSLAAAGVSVIAFALGVNGAAGATLPRVQTSIASKGVRSEPATIRGSLGQVETGEEIFRTTCAACHGATGAGAPQTTVGFAVPLPDFTDCKFNSSEADADWAAIVRDGGPVRGLTRIMPAFRDLLTPEQIQRVITYIRTLCTDRRWPRGEFNVPLAQTTEKAFPEDEVVLTSTVNTDAPGSVSNHLIFEKRFWSRDQLELDVPFGFVDRPGDASWIGGLGDVSIAEKHVLISSLASGTIVSSLAGVILPTGAESTGLGTGTTAFEGFLLGAQLLPARSYFQFQGGIELPTDLSRAQRSAFWSGTLGTTIPFGPISRIWSPMIGVSGQRDLVNGAPVEWDLAPQFQISLSALQHVRANIGVDIPLTQRAERHSQILAYLLWDTFDGPLFKSWRGWCPGCQH